MGKPSDSFLKSTSQAIFLTTCYFWIQLRYTRLDYQLQFVSILHIIGGVHEKLISIWTVSVLNVSRVMNVIIYWTNKNQEKSRENISSPTVSVHICIKNFSNGSFEEGDSELNGKAFQSSMWRFNKRDSSKLSSLALPLDCFYFWKLYLWLATQKFVPFRHHTHVTRCRASW